MLDLIDNAGILHGYLENQIFLLSLLKGKNIIWKRAVSIAGCPYLVRYAKSTVVRTVPGSGLVESKEEAY